MQEVVGFDMLMCIMKCLEYCLRQGRIMIHCHSGLGRTALVSCSWMIYGIGLSAQEAIKAFKLRRRGEALSSKKQLLCLEQFESCIPILN